MPWSDVYFNEFSFANRELDDVSGKKAVGLDWQNKNFARASRFFGHFFLPSMHDYNVVVPTNSRFVEDLNTRQRLSFSFPEL